MKSSYLLNVRPFSPRRKRAVAATKTTTKARTYLVLFVGDRPTDLHTPPISVSPAIAARIPGFKKLSSLLLDPEDMAML